MPRNDPILIASAPRSGSSLTANIIHAAGAFGGVMKPGDQWNPRGYFENVEITGQVVDYLQLNDLKMLGKRYQPPCLRAPRSLFREDVRSIMADQGVGDMPWFYKNPKLPICWRLWDAHFPDARWVIVRRDTGETLRSIMRTEFMDGWDTTQQWYSMLLQYETWLRQIESVCNVVASIDAARFFDSGNLAAELLCDNLELPRVRVQSIIEPGAWNATA